MKNRLARMLIFITLLFSLLGFTGMAPVYAEPFDAKNDGIRSLNPEHGPIFRPQMTAGTWNALGATPLNGVVMDMASSGTDLYVGGYFTNVGGNPNINYLAKWNGTSWSAVGTPLNGAIEAIAISGNDVYVGGAFINAGGDSNADHFAKWDGIKWSAVGATSFNAYIGDIAIIGSDIYVGGAFNTMSSLPNNSFLAKWDGSSWSALGSKPLNSYVFAIGISGNDIYVGGLFTDAGGDPNADSIAKWNGMSWSALGTKPMNNSVNAIAISGTDVYAGGYFTNTGGDPNADGIAKWNGTKWSALGKTSLSVHDIAISGSHVYVGGDLGGTPGNIVRWDGTSWSELTTTPLNSSVYAIAVIGTDVYVGGRFTDAGGGANADYIVRFIQPNPVAVTINQAVGQIDPTTKAPIHFTAVFSEPVSGFTGADIRYNGTTLAGSLWAAVTEIAPNDGTTYDVAIRGTIPKGTVTVSIPAGKVSSIPRPIATNKASTSTDNSVTFDHILVEFGSNATNDGWLLESTETSGIGGSLDATATTLTVGDDANNRQYASLVEFNTAALPDNAVIFAANLRVIQASVTGTNPFTTHGLLRSEIKTGFFGASNLLELPDFQSAANQLACKFQSVPEILESLGPAYRCIVADTAFPFINRTGSTQLRLRFATDDNNNQIADTFNFYSGNFSASASQRPRLFIKYYIPPAN